MTSVSDNLSPWPLYGYAPGNYLCDCYRCKSTFEGDKRAMTCLECAVKQSKRVEASNDLVGEMEPQVVALNDMREIAKELGYPSILEALEDLSRMRDARNGGGGE